MHRQPKRHIRYPTKILHYKSNPERLSQGYEFNASYRSWTRGHLRRQRRRRWRGWWSTATPAAVAGARWRPHAPPPHPHPIRQCWIEQNRITFWARHKQGITRRGERREEEGFKAGARTGGDAGAGGRGRRRPSPASPAPAAGWGRRAAARSSCPRRGGGKDPRRGRGGLDRERWRRRRRQGRGGRLVGREEGLSVPLWAFCGLGCVGLVLHSGTGYARFFSLFLQ
jgi:hypothetical protein